MSQSSRDSYVANNYSSESGRVVLDSFDRNSRDFWKEINRVKVWTWFVVWVYLGQGWSSQCEVWGDKAENCIVRVGEDKFIWA